jgi:ACR3 family arsenite efflux pump ArsB
MMWPALAKVQYERIPPRLPTRALWEQIGVALLLNWVIGPFVSAIQSLSFILLCSSSASDTTSAASRVDQP